MDSQSPDGAAFYTSGRASNEAAFLYQLFARQFGTNNLPDCSNMCHESSGTALVESLGIGKGSVKLEDFEQTDLILIVGQNPGTNHPRMLTSLEHAKKHGARIIAINPLPEVGFLRFTDPNPDEYPTPLHFAAHVLGSGTPLADMHLPVRINGDIALLKGLMKVMLAEEESSGGVLDHDFIRDHTDGFAELYADLEATSWREIVDGCGINREEIERAGRLVAGSRRIIACWAMGLTQHRDAVVTIRTLVNLLLLGGHIGRPGAGTCCVRGHSNVQGDRTMGIWERPPAPFLNSLAKEFGFEPPRKAGRRHGGYHRRHARWRNRGVRGPGREFPVGRARHRMYGRGTPAMPPHRAHRHQAQPVPPDHRPASAAPSVSRAGPSAIPVAALSVEDAFGIISSSTGRLDPASPMLRSEAAIVAGIAEATLGDRSRIGWKDLAGDYSKIRDHISRVVPGFERYNERMAQGPFYLPNTGPRAECSGRRSGRAQFAVAPISEHDLSGERFIMMTIRSHDQFNTTIYGLHDRYRGVHGGRRVLFINPDDAESRGWTAGMRVDITSHFEDERRVARSFQLVFYPIPRRCVAAYFPEANVLVPIGSVAEESNTPTSSPFT